MARLSNHIVFALEQGVPPETIAKDLGCSLEDVLRHIDMPYGEIEADDGPLVIQGNEIILANKHGALEFADEIEGSNNLAKELRVAAGTTLRQAQLMMGKAETAKEIQQLATAIASLQNAFFSRPNSVIITPPTEKSGNVILQAFKEKMRS